MEKRVYAVVESAISKKMKNKSSNTMWLRIMVVLNTIAVASYIFYGEYEKKQPRMVKHVCQTVAADQEKGLIALTCLED